MSAEDPRLTKCTRAVVPASSRSFGMLQYLHRGKERLQPRDSRAVQDDGRSPPSDTPLSVPQPRPHPTRPEIAGQLLDSHEAINGVHHQAASEPGVCHEPRRSIQVQATAGSDHSKRYARVETQQR